VTVPVKPVSPDRRAARVADTEAKILTAARALFLERGYVAATLTDIAEGAGVAARTVYVRFGTKATLFRRVVDVALVGDTEPIDVAHRPDARRALTAVTLEERVEAMVALGAGIMGRAGALFVVAAQAEAAEPEIAAAAQAGRRATYDQYAGFWRQAQADRLLASGADVEWLGATSAVVGAADTWVHIARTMGWTVPIYTAWLRTTMRHLAGLD
jgi:AcrR family transcriptional regulator